MKFSCSTTEIRPDHCSPLHHLQTLGSGREFCALLESADRNHGVNDRSFLALGARDIITVKDGKVFGSKYVEDGEVKDPLSPFEGLIGEGKEGELLQMGYIGFLTYEATRLFEDIDLPTKDGFPDALFVLPEVIIDMHHTEKVIRVHAHSDTEEDMESIVASLQDSPYGDDGLKRIEKERPHLPSLTDIEEFRTVSREEHCKRVETIREKLRDGEAFQVVLSQELCVSGKRDPLKTYEALRSINPSPYMYYFRTPQQTVVGASPETLIRVSGRSMLYRPIAGTRKRTGDAEKDAAMKAELLADEKERAEHQMLVDLGRNDVGRIAEIGSIQVEDAFHCETYAHVFHIVTDIYGTLKEGATSLDAVRSVLPAGTLTGAPKLRAMEIIRELESSPRGIYGGAFGYIDLSGNLDLAITIRTIVFTEDGASLRAGGGIVLDSVGEHEDNECLHKARSCLAALSISTDESPLASARGDT